MPRIRRIAITAILMSGFFLMACEQSFRFEGRYEEGERDAFYKSTFSTKLEGAYEKSGTVFESQHRVIWKDSSNLKVWDRKPVAFSAKGWNKNLLAEEWIGSLPMRIAFGEKEIYTSGFKGLYDTLKTFSQHKTLQNRMLYSTDTTAYLRELKLRWYLMHMVPAGEYKKRENLQLKVPEDLLNGMQVDSIVVTGERIRNERSCFEYSVYYKMEDSLRLDMEQLFVSFPQEMNKFQFNYWQSSPDGGPRIIKEGLWEKEELEGEWHFSLDRENGIPCYESKKEEARVLLDDPGATRKINAYIYRFLEYVYR